jgi:hypothetical protein
MFEDLALSPVLPTKSIWRVSELVRLLIEAPDPFWAMYNGNSRSSHELIVDYFNGIGSSLQPQKDRPD